MTTDHRNRSAGTAAAFDDDELPAASEDLRLFCNRCCRFEYHFLSVKAHGRHIYRLWRYWSFGLIDLVGTFRCRCCGHARLWRFDLFRSGPSTAHRRTRERHAPHSDSDDSHLA